MSEGRDGGGDGDKRGKREEQRGERRRRGYDSPPRPRGVPAGRPDVNQQEERPGPGQPREQERRRDEAEPA